MKTINRTHKPEFISQKGNINHWELINSKNGKHQVSHINLLSKHAFTNQAPNVMILEVLNKEAEDKKFRLSGLEPLKNIRNDLTSDDVEEKKIDSSVNPPNAASPIK